MAEELVLDKIKKTNKKKEKEKMYHVVFCNDDYTWYEFVIMCLQVVFNKSGQEAKMLTDAIQVHDKLVVGTYTLEEAEARVKAVEELKLMFNPPQPLVVLIEQA